MIVVIDTNVLLQLFGSQPRHSQIMRALIEGRIRLAVSSSIFMEYQEIVTSLAKKDTWIKIEHLLQLIAMSHDSIIETNPSFQFQIINKDPDDNKFTDCAITAGADFVITEDRHFSTLKDAGYKPQPISPSEFIDQFLIQAPR